MSTPPLQGVSRLLVLMPSWVGDIVMATPLLRALRTALPNAAIAALTRPALRSILDGAPWIDEHFEAPMRGMQGPFTGLARARAFRADAVLLLPNSVRAALSAMALAKRRIGYGTQMRSALLSHACPPPSRAAPIPAVDYYADLGAWALGSPIEDRRPELFVTAEERAAADALVGRRAVLVVNPGANRADKRWPADRFAAAAAQIAAERGLDVAVTGGPAERELAAQVASSIVAALEHRTHAPERHFDATSDPGSRSTALPRSGERLRVIDLVERGVTLGSLKAVLASAQMLLTNDTGPRHLAAALGTPSIVLFGPTDHRWTTLPAAHDRGGDRLLIAEPFLPETRMADQLPEVCRIDRISVGDAVDAARAIKAR